MNPTYCRTSPPRSPNSPALHATASAFLLAALLAAPAAADPEPTTPKSDAKAEVVDPLRAAVKLLPTLAPDAAEDLMLMLREHRLKANIHWCELLIDLNRTPSLRHQAACAAMIAGDYRMELAARPLAYDLTLSFDRPIKADAQLNWSRYPVSTVLGQLGPIALSEVLDLLGKSDDPLKRKLAAGVVRELTAVRTGTGPEAMKLNFAAITLRAVAAKTKDPARKKRLLDALEFFKDDKDE